MTTIKDLVNDLVKYVVAEKLESPEEIDEAIEATMEQIRKILG